MPNITKRERVGTEVFDVEYEEKTRTKVTNESLALNMISVYLSNTLGISSTAPTPEQLVECAEAITLKLRQANLLK